ncbi:MAG: hypothetical protein H6851_00250 [Geminicoccaceae bacterium]|nr:hypothetical protein [Geminicoccaceae bacterium]
MAPRANPKKLNALQLKTLTILQYLTRFEGWSHPADENGDVTLKGLPSAHGNHFHVGDAVVATRDTSGLFNAAVYTVLEKRGLVRPSGNGLPVVTREGIEYETGIADQILHTSDH